MNIYDAIDLWATALQADATIQAYCVNNFGKGLLVQVDDDNENPLSSADAPYCLLFAYSGGEDSPASEDKIQQARIVVGTVQAGTSPHTPTVTNTRSATANGLRKYGAGNLAVDLLDLVLASIKAVTITDYSLFASATYDVDGLLFFPLCVAGTTAQLRQPRDLSTFG
jgi:hypothetical protein